MHRKKKIGRDRASVLKSQANTLILTDPFYMYHHGHGNVGYRRLELQTACPLLLKLQHHVLTMDVDITFIPSP